MTDKNDKIAILRNSHTPEKIPAEWWKKLSPFEVDHMKRNVIPKHGDVLSPRNRELLRDRNIIMKGDVIYRQQVVMVYAGTMVKLVKLTSEEITKELLDRAENDRIQEIGEVPWWELQGITREEFYARKATQKAHEAEVKAKTLTRGQWGAAAKKAYGRSVSSDEIEDYMLDNETTEQRMQREYDEAMGLGISSFRKGGIRIRDKQVHKGIFYCVTAYVFYTYPTVMHIAIVLALLIAFRQVLREYLKIRRRAKADFMPDPKSRYSSQLQYEHWVADRKRWKLDLDEKTKKKSK